MKGHEEDAVSESAMMAAWWPGFAGLAEVARDEIEKAAGSDRSFDLASRYLRRPPKAAATPPRTARPSWLSMALHVEKPGSIPNGTVL